MKRFIAFGLLLFSIVSYGQSPEVMDAYIRRAGTRYSHSGRTYTEIYEVLTDSIVYSFGMEFRSADSSFVRKVPMESCSRKTYDMMQKNTEEAISKQEEMRKETLKFLDETAASYEVWKCFQFMGK